MAYSNQEINPHNKINFHASDYTDEFSFILKPSTILDAGIGVFATHTINSGVKLQLAPRRLRWFKIFYTRRFKANQLPDQFKPYCIIEDNATYRAPLHFNRMEIGWFINHTFNPNIEKRTDGFYALHVIAAGEEILMDYNQLMEPEDKKEAYYKK